MQQVKFKIENAKSSGTASCSFLGKNIWYTIKCHTAVADVPLLIFLAEMDHLQISWDNTVDLIAHISSKAQAHGSRKFGSTCLCWYIDLNPFFTVTEFNWLPRRFGHLTAENLHNFLCRARPEEVSSSTVRLSQNVAYRLLMSAWSFWATLFQVYSLWREII